MRVRRLDLFQESIAPSSYGHKENTFPLKRLSALLLAAG